MKRIPKREAAVRDALGKSIKESLLEGYSFYLNGSDEKKITEVVPMQSSGKSLSYLTKEGLHNVWVNRMMSLASVAVLTSCLTIIGCAAMLFLMLPKCLIKSETKT